MILGITESTENLHQLKDIVYDFCSKLHLCAKVYKSAVLVFIRDKVKGTVNVRLVAHAPIVVHHRKKLI